MHSCVTPHQSKVGTVAKWHVWCGEVRRRHRVVVEDRSVAPV